jgi:uncharacterized protein YjiS (DUF1127 family)
MNVTTNTIDSGLNTGLNTAAHTGRAPSNWLVGLIANVRAAAAARSLRASLAVMDDNQLRDIGIADDEIYRIRRQDSFTPQSWR